MKLAKAIKDLQARIDGEFNVGDVDNCEDMKLGIEAMELLERIRKNPTVNKYSTLPGETEE